ncbi:MAG: PVC-type heme-binding CxxCH protein [Akkermansiaceae bacterium]
MILSRSALILLSSTLIAGADQQTMLKDFTVAPGLEAKLWAGTDMVHSPTAIDVDAKGRLWVTEDLQKSGEKGPHSRIKILADTNNDGKADSVKIFGPTFGSKPLGISVFDNVIVVSMAPNIHVYTDVNRDDVFDPKVDTEKIIAKGFHGRTHDHALHAVVPGPSGKWYFNHGNIGADVTMSDGRQINASSYYSQNPRSIGKKSFDGRLYVGGFGVRMNPDGSKAEVIFQNTRNTHAMLVNSFGEVFTADNDDPTHCRAAWAMEHGNFGYASLEDGNRSWEDSAKSWEKRTVTQEVKDTAYERHGKSVLRRDDGHWREHFPGVTPPGNVWGPGGPTGDYFIEGDELGKEHRGRYLVCETVHRGLFSFRPTMNDAQIEMKELDKMFFTADRKSKNPAASGFMPTDVVANTDGALFVSDWNSHVNSRGAGNSTGGIFRIARKGSSVKLPTIDFSTTAGLLEALRSPAPGVRWVAQDRLKKRDDAFTQLLAFSKKHADNAYYCARAAFIMAQLKDERGPASVKALLSAEDPHWRILAIRALRHAEREPMVPILTQMANDKHIAVRREVLSTMRGMKLADISAPLAKLIASYDGKNRWYLEALGAVTDDYPEEVYQKLIKPTQPEPKSWTARQRNLAWRVRSPQALADLADCMIAQNVDLSTFRQLAYTYGLCYTDTERKKNYAFFQRFKKHPAFSGADYQLTITEFLEKDVNDPDPIALTQSYLFPKKFGIPTKIGTVKEISALKPNIDNGRSKAALCTMCHQIGSNGAPFGPNLTNWGQVRKTSEVVQAIINPSAELAHGYDKPLVITQNGHRMEGVARGYSYHAGAIRVKTVGGSTIKVPFRRPNAKIQYLKNHSWMPSASNMGLSNQDVRDIAAYLMSDIAGEIDSGLVAKIEPKFSKGEGPGWIALDGEDFVNVNCHPDTWKWEKGHAFCNGKPTGVIRYRKPLTNFEFSCEWMHKQKGGNSGVFVWATPQSINRLAAGHGRLPQGIEVQVLDLGYREIYEKQYKKKGDWFTSHGDVFPVGPIKMKPFPPVAPNGRRSFPSKNTTKGINQWNHYYVRAIDGVVRLWVNGVEVSGGEDINPRAGYLCLESEGAPVEFKNIRLRVHAPFETKLAVPLTDPKKPVAKPKPVSLKGHALLGTWKYLKDHSREFTADGFCILRSGKKVEWKKRVTSATKDSITVEGRYQHILKGDTLHIEGRYQAKR